MNVVPRWLIKNMSYSFRITLYFFIYLWSNRSVGSWIRIFENGFFNPIAYVIHRRQSPYADVANVTHEVPPTRTLCQYVPLGKVNINKSTWHFFNSGRRNSGCVGITSGSHPSVLVKRGSRVRVPRVGTIADGSDAWQSHRSG